MLIVLGRFHGVFFPLSLTHHGFSNDVIHWGIWSFELKISKGKFSWEKTTKAWRLYGWAAPFDKTHPAPMEVCWFIPLFTGVFYVCFWKYLMMVQPISFWEGNVQYKSRYWKNWGFFEGWLRVASWDAPPPNSKRWLPCILVGGHAH